MTTVVVNEQFIWGMLPEILHFMDGELAVE